MPDIEIDLFPNCEPANGYVESYKAEPSEEESPPYVDDRTPDLFETA